MLLISFILGFSLVQILGYLSHFSRTTFQRYEILKESSSDPRQETGFPERKRKGQVAIDGNSINAQHWSLKGHPIPLFYAQIRDTKLFFETNLIASVNSKGIELTELKKIFKVFEALYQCSLDAWK